GRGPRRVDQIREAPVGLEGQKVGREGRQHADGEEQGHTQAAAVFASGDAPQLAPRGPGEADAEAQAEWERDQDRHGREQSTKGWARKYGWRPWRRAALTILPDSM